MKTILLDRAAYLEVESVAIYYKGGWALSHKTIKARQKFFKQYFCGRLLKADLSSINFN